VETLPIAAMFAGRTAFLFANAMHFNYLSKLPNAGLRFGIPNFRDWYIRGIGLFGIFGDTTPRGFGGGISNIFEMPISSQ
jgi:hypothetical protein